MQLKQSDQRLSGRAGEKARSPEQVLVWSIWNL